MGIPLFADQEFLLVINSDEGDIVARGIVRYTRPGGIAGLNFTRLSEKAATRLGHLIQNLNDKTTPGVVSPT